MHINLLHHITDNLKLIKLRFKRRSVQVIMPLTLGLFDSEERNSFI